MRPASVVGRMPHFGFKLPNCGGVLCEVEWATPTTILELARYARELGYESVWLHDHLLTPRELRHLERPPFYEPLVAMAAIAGAVPEIQVGVATIILPFRDPVVFAKQAVTLDRFFPKRMVFGLGLGQYESEFDAFGADTYKSRGRVANDYLAVIEALMAAGPATVTTPSRSVTDAEMNPKGTFPVEPPIWIGGNSEPAAKRAARFGCGWIFSGALSPGEAQDRLGSLQLPQRRFDVVLTATVARDDRAGSAAAEQEHRIHQHSSVVTGDAAAAAEQIEAYVGAGVTHFLLTFRSGGMDTLRSQMEWFQQDVVPLLAYRQSTSETTS